MMKDRASCRRRWRVTGSERWQWTEAAGPLRADSESTSLVTNPKLSLFSSKMCFLNLVTIMLLFWIRRDSR